jgi:tetratricopeptide (TPR) repeat protein
MVKTLLILWTVVCLLWMSRLLGVGALIASGVLIVLILVLMLIGKKVSAARRARRQRDLESIRARGRAMEEAGLHAEACWFYARMVRERGGDRERIGRLRREHGPFDWSAKLADLERGSRSRLQAFVEYDTTVAVIEEREVPGSQACYNVEDFYTAQQCESEGRFAAAVYHYAEQIWLGSGPETEKDAEEGILRLWKAHGPFDYTKVPDGESEDTHDTVVRLIHFVGDGTLMPSRRATGAASARRQLERGKELEHGGQYAEACYLYAEMLRTQPKILEYAGVADECRSRMDTLRRLHGPFDWSRKLAEISSGDRARYLDHERTVATMEGCDVSEPWPFYGGDSNDRDAYEKAREAEAAGRYEEAVHHYARMWYVGYGKAQEAEAAGRCEEAIYHYAHAVWDGYAPDTGAARIRALVNEHGPFDYSRTLPGREVDDGEYEAVLRLIRFVVEQT